MSLLSDIRYQAGVGVENLGGFLGIPETPLHVSEFIAGRNTPKSVGVSNAQAPNVLSRPAAVQNTPARTIDPNRPTFGSSGLTNYQVQVGGGMAPTNSSGGGGSINSEEDAIRNGYASYADAVARGAASVARSQSDAELQAANSAFDYQRDQLHNQLSSLGTQRDNSLNDIELGLSGVRSQVDTSRNNAKTNTQTQIAEAGNTAKSTQQANRNVLRALGILNSTAAGELLSKPVNEFDKQRANLNSALGQRMTELDQFLDQKAAEANNAKNNILSQYTDLYNNIQTDLRFNERQRVDAVRQASAALQSRLADIQNSLLSFQNQVQLQKSNISQGLNQINSYANPTYDAQGFSQLSLSTPEAQRQQIGIVSTPEETKKRQGLLSNPFATA